MKRIILIAGVLLFTSGLSAQKDSTFYRNEVKLSVSDAICASIFWTYDWRKRDNATLFANVSLSYFYRPVKWLWVGGNFVNYFGNRIYYDWREYYPDGRYRDFTKSKIKYCGVVAPEIRFSYLNRKSVILYSAFSGGIGLENGFNRKYYNYPELNYYFHLTYFGFSCNFGENQNGFLGGELGVGMKGFFIFHGGYRF